MIPFTLYTLRPPLVGASSPHNALEKLAHEPLIVVSLVEVAEGSVKRPAAFEFLTPCKRVIIPHGAAGETRRVAPGQNVEVLVAPGV